jgi:NitT/TauT family transport system substrate-binding protein
MTGPSSEIGRRKFLQTAAIAVPASGGALSVFLSGCGTPDGDEATARATASGTSGASPVNQSFTTPFGFIPSFVETYVAAQEGFWKNQGLDVTIHGGQGTAAGLQTVISGSSQYGRGGATNIVDIVNQDVPIKFFLQAYREPGFSVASLPESPVDRPHDLAGKSVGIVSAGGETQALLTIMLELAGIPKSSVDTPVVGVGPGAYQLAKSGKVDAWVALDQDLYGLARKGIKIHSFNLGKYLPIPTETYASSLKNIEKHRDAAVKFSAGLLKAYAFCKDKTNWRQAWKDTKHYAPSTTYDVMTNYLHVVTRKWYLDGTDKLGEVDPADWKRAQKDLKKVGMIHKTVPLNRIIDPDIVPKAKAELH